jgi:tetratricopeptide (TPR) repeat protein
MRSTFYIHIGVHKTGTKSIQHTLSGNREKLLAHGINSFPGEPNHGPALISLLSERPHRENRNLRKHVDTPEKAASFNASIGHKITKALARNRSPKMVISGEGLSGLSETEMHRLKQLLGPYAAGYRIIVYVRDPYEYSNSASLQRLKAGSVLGDSYRNIPLPNYRRRLEKFIAVFGRDNVDIRVFHPQHFVGGDLVPDFLSAIGESPELAKSLKVVRANESMSHEAALILSETNAVIPSFVDRRGSRVRAFGFHTYIVGIKGEKFAMDPIEYLKHEAEVLEDIEWLNQTIGQPVFGRSIPRPASAPRWSQPTIDSIKDLVSHLSAELRKAQNKSRRLTRIPPPPIPPGLEWLREAYGQTEPGDAAGQAAVVPQFDQASVRALGCFLHAIALAIQHLQAEYDTYRGRWLLCINPREAENHLREMVRLNPTGAEGHYRLSQASLLRGHFVEARRAAEAAAKLAPKRAAFRRWLKLAKVAERWLSKPAPAPAAPVKRKPRQTQPVRTKAGDNRQKARAERPAKAGQAASHRPPQ